MSDRIVEDPYVRIERLALLRDLARCVGNHPTCPERERAAAVQRVHKYTDQIQWLERQVRR